MAIQRDLSFLQNLARRLRKPSEIRVLVVDPDEAGARRLVSELGQPFAVTLVTSAEAALAAIRAHPPTIVVTELDLPGITGLNLLGSLHADPATRHMLLVVLTGRASMRDKIAAFQTGADDYLVKPLEPQQFATHIGRVSLFRQVFPSSAS